MPASATRTVTAESPVTNSVSLHLFGGPYVVVAGRRAVVPESSKRLIAYVAINGRRVERRQAAGTLWPSGDEVRAAGNLRSALWRLKGAGIDLLDADKRFVELRPATVVDVDVAADWAVRLVTGRASTADVLRFPWRELDGELLPGCDDDWVCFERERVRQRRLHALEALSHHLVALARFTEAVEVAVALVAAEPSRESARRVLAAARRAAAAEAAAETAAEAAREVPVPRRPV